MVILQEERDAGRLMRVSFRGTVAEREFEKDGDPPLKLAEDADFLAAFSNALAAAHELHPDDVRAIVDVAVEKHRPDEPEPLPWYWAEFFDTMKTAFEKGGGETRTFTLAIKGCRDYFFYTLRESAAGKPGEWKHVPFFQRSAPPKSADAAAHLRGIADLIMSLTPRLERLRGDGQWADFLAGEKHERLVREITWFDVELECTIAKSDPEQTRGELYVRMTPFAHEPSEVIVGASTPILVTSPNVRTAIHALSEVWLSPKPKSVLISAWTGSGKEVLVSLLGDALRVGKRRLTLSAAEVVDMRRFAREIEARMDDLGLKDKGRAGRGDGNSRPAKKPAPEMSLVFVDEIHHDAARDLRPGLLRLLETDELPIPERPHPIDFSRVVYVFAASQQPRELRAGCEPRDLWTRIEHTVEMSHPLKIADPATRADVLKSYFLLFWTSNKRAWDEQQHPRPACDKVRALLGGGPEPNDVEKELARLFCLQFASPFIPIMSVRSLRTIVKRLFGRTVTFLRTRDGRPATAGELTNEFERWIRELSDELLVEPDPRNPY